MHTSTETHICDTYNTHMPTDTDTHICDTYNTHTPTHPHTLIQTHIYVTHTIRTCTHTHAHDTHLLRHMSHLLCKHSTATHCNTLQHTATVRQLCCGHLTCVTVTQQVCYTPSCACVYCVCHTLTGVTHMMQTHICVTRTIHTCTQPRAKKNMCVILSKEMCVLCQMCDTMSVTPKMCESYVTLYACH